jgi:hypothetical protein
MSIVKAISKQFERMEERGWDKIFYFFDIHETILYPDYTNEEPLRYYPHAKEVLEYLSARDDIGMSLYTCSWPKEIQHYREFFAEDGIHFDYVNKNPDVENTKYGYYEDKPYFNVLFEDKAGFDPENDWYKIKEYFKLVS